MCCSDKPKVAVVIETFDMCAGHSAALREALALAVGVALAEFLKANGFDAVPVHMQAHEAKPTVN